MRVWMIVLVCLIVAALCIQMPSEAQGGAQEIGYESVRVVFCPEQDCVGELERAVSGGSEVECAFFDLDLEGLIQALENVSARVVVDYRNDPDKEFIRLAKGQGYMHNKFCIIDDRIVTTGSFNPTDNGADRNNNNLLMIDSPELAGIYSKEFDELWNGTYSGGVRTEQHSGPVRVCFSPEDDCVQMIIDELDKAESEIRFMIFSFTHTRIAMHLALAKENGVKVEGLMEKQQLSKYSMHDFFIGQGISVVLENTGAFLHHKVFIIDGETVITGSFNPSENAAKRNDENVVVIKNRALAEAYIEEYNRLKSIFN
ncbi:MAG: hypothetical protein KJ709_03190 [Nanoarchaeota archaeon]|nr:hypothetical protein [Nanoarchaeota archaeon]